MRKLIEPETRWTGWFGLLHGKTEKDEKEKILNNFLKRKYDILVHCTVAVGRSPAVAMALNDTFDFGYDSKRIAEKYKAYNKYVHRILCDTAPELGIGPSDIR